MGSLRRCSSRCSSRSRPLLWVLMLAALAPLLISCDATSGPDVILVPALIATRTQVRTAEGFRARVFVTLEDGTLTISRGRVSFPAGAWITLVSKEELAAGEAE